MTRRTTLAAWIALALGIVPSTAHAQTVADVIPAMGPCQSHLVRGLSDQLLRAQVCAYPDSLVAFSHPNIRSGSGVNQYGSPEMVAALLSVAASNDLILNDAFRTVVMQYAYVATDQPGNADGCFGPASPGTSRHEWGNAVDIENHEARRGAMTAAGFVWAGSGDPVHFSTGPERRGTGVRTFQHLWNLNHPEAPIDEDGIYGPQTEGALRRSPAGGFATDGCAADRDGDGSPEGMDCDDTNPARHPGATESCDAVDEDCDASVDEDVVSLCGGEGTCTTGMQVCAAGVWGTCEGQVCNDPDAGLGDAAVRSRDAGVADGSTTSSGRTSLSGGCACSADGGGNRHGGGAAGWLLVLGVLAWRRRRPIHRLAPRS